MKTRWPLVAIVRRAARASKIPFRVRSLAKTPVRAPWHPGTGTGNVAGRSRRCLGEISKLDSAGRQCRRGRDRIDLQQVTRFWNSNRGHARRAAGKPTAALRSARPQRHGCVAALSRCCDLETPVGNRKDISHITAEAVIEAAQKLTGKLKQVPPQHSAIRVGGKRVYQQARKGEHTQLGWRDVEVKTFEILDEKFPEVSFRVVCSKGTYIRSLVRDLGSDLNVGAYLKSLRRTRIGSSRVEDALSPVEFLELTKAMTS